jgi:hypothetical protein
MISLALQETPGNFHQLLPGDGQVDHQGLGILGQADGLEDFQGHVIHFSMINQPIFIPGSRPSQIFSMMDR